MPENVFIDLSLAFWSLFTSHLLKNRLSRSELNDRRSITKKNPSRDAPNQVGGCPFVIRDDTRRVSFWVSCFFTVGSGALTTGYMCGERPVQGSLRNAFSISRVGNMHFRSRLRYHALFDCCTIRTSSASFARYGNALRCCLRASYAWQLNI